MNTGGDAAEQVVRLSLEGFEVAAKLSGTAAKELTILLVSVLKQEQKTKGKARLANMLKSGKELKVFSIPSKDLEKFTEQAKKYGVLYCVLRDKGNKSENAPVDIIARAEDASKIQRIFDRYELGKIDKASIVAGVERSTTEQDEHADGMHTKTKGEELLDEVLSGDIQNEDKASIAPVLQHSTAEPDEPVEEIPAKAESEKILDEVMAKPIQKDGNANENPSVAKADKNPPSRPNSGEIDMHSDKGSKVESTDKKPSVREKLNRYRAEAKKDKEAERAEPEKIKDIPKPQNSQTVHMQKTKKKKNNKSKGR